MVRQAIVPRRPGPKRASIKSAQWKSVQRRGLRHAERIANVLVRFTQELIDKGAMPKLPMIRCINMRRLGRFVEQSVEAGWWLLLLIGVFTVAHHIRTPHLLRTLIRQWACRSISKSMVEINFTIGKISGTSSLFRAGRWFALLEQRHSI